VTETEGHKIVPMKQS